FYNILCIFQETLIILSLIRNFPNNPAAYCPKKLMVFQRNRKIFRPRGLFRTIFISNIEKRPSRVVGHTGMCG
ncbi:MAG: hypothetical protein JXQ65_11645, partial [Candidatus Marinimicrobia bacterium]|nr:hypothetical protein [Candidatus Neomarinimicrobiota bacterium]